MEIWERRLPRVLFALALCVLVGAWALSMPFLHAHSLGPDGQDRDCTACKWSQAVGTTLLSPGVLFETFLAASGPALEISIVPVAGADVLRAVPRGPPFS